MFRQEMQECLRVWWADRAAHKHKKAMYGYGTTPLDFNIWCVRW